MFNPVLFLGLMDLIGFGGGLGGTFKELELGLKIVMLLTIIGFVRSHVQDPTVSVILIVIFAYLILIQNWAWLGPFYVFYMLIMFGLAGVIGDFFFVSQTVREHGAQAQMGGEHHMPGMPGMGHEPRGGLPGGGIPPSMRGGGH
ncbi:MAG: hypothetical protein GOV15_02410 [Candidatus Diapherotrites archaeon]|nr:hypothetical protein [Candidatus Diapherotrites archaeon]